ncbi:DUF484 family protein [Hahella aquimaris]|uniref:DUF484 family protein n=1 Tax=Hahella sp. HNIBRBA332 TaxID=3015983 RepID=UPI00273BF3FF|nr:DUF484 family protein [Hahella sp. HNIBRBA332]WLQ12788.1 DUF484 family protein [Hahella sp. HNIBRBA332]
MNNQAKRSDENPALTAEAVVAYLREHPNFFVEHEELLNEIRLPHRSGAAISLVERQISLFREQRDHYERQLYDLIDTARQNDRFFEKSKRLLMNLLEARSLDEVVIVLEDSFTGDFQVDFCSLVLFAEHKDFPISNVSTASLTESSDALGEELLNSVKAVCGNLEPRQLQVLFPHNHSDIASCAVIPLRYGDLLGMLSIGSRNERYFNTSMGSLFLSYISESLSRMLPPLLAKEGRGDEHFPD